MAQDLDIGMKCIKYMLFVANFMFVMVGVLLISFGSTIKSIYYDFELFMEDYYFSPAKLTIAIGIIILMISAFGCAAAIKESTCMVNMYAVLLTLVLLLELSTSIAAYSMRVNIETYMGDRMNTVMHNYLTDNEATEAFDYLQRSYQCCGIHRNTDWLTVENITEIPRSCCIPRKPAAIEHCELYDRSCLDMLSSIMKQSSVMLGTGALCITIVQVLGIAFAVMLAKSIRRIKSERAAQRWQSRQELYLQLARGNDKNQPTPVPVTYTAEQNASTA